MMIHYQEDYEKFEGFAIPSLSKYWLIKMHNFELPQTIIQ